jgi:glucose-6-phosphate 1-dehydrogenase
VAHGPDALRQAQARLLESIRPLGPADLVRGQYVGYHAIPGVRPDSDVETFVALRLFIDSYRWAGVPFFIRAGKRLPVTATEAVVEFREPPLNVFPEVPTPPGPVYLRFRFHPDAEVALSFRVWAPGRTPPTQVSELVVTRREPESQTPYERLLGAGIEGRSASFVRQDSVEACWRIVGRVLAEHGPALRYPPATWGPSQAAPLIAPGRWFDPRVD